MIKNQIVKQKGNSNEKNNGGSMEKLIFDEKKNEKNDKEIELDMFKTTDFRSRKGLIKKIFFLEFFQILNFFNF